MHNHPFVPVLWRDGPPVDEPLPVARSSYCVPGPTVGGNRLPAAAVSRSVDQPGRPSGSLPPDPPTAAPSRVLGILAVGVASLGAVLPIAELTSYEGAPAEGSAAMWVQVVAVLLALLGLLPSLLTKGHSWLRLITVAVAGSLVLPAFALAVAGVDLLVDLEDSDASGRAGSGRMVVVLACTLIWARIVDDVVRSWVARRRRPPAPLATADRGRIDPGRGW